LADEEGDLHAIVHGGGVEGDEGALEAGASAETSASLRMTGELTATCDGSRRSN
jgi:hypothetical protein